MHTSLQLIELAKQRLALKHELTLPVTDYRLAKLMDLSTSVVSGWRRGTRHIGTEFVRKFADACELPEAYVYACIEHDRASDPALARVLEVIANAFKGAAATVILAVGMSLALPGNQAYSADFTSDNTIHYAKSARRRAKRRATGSGFLVKISRFLMPIPINHLLFA